MNKLTLWQKMCRQESPQHYADKDGKLQAVLGKREMIAMGMLDQRLLFRLFWQP